MKELRTGGRRRGWVVGALACGLAAAGLGWAVGCAGSAEIGQGEVYPRTLTRGPTLNIQVFRRQTELEFTNTTAQVFGPGRLWLNGWYSRELPGLAIGQTVTLPLREFKDRYGDPFRGGGFFATERAERLALAELQINGQMLGFVVVGAEDQ